VYTRSKQQKRTFYLLILAGFLLLVGVPTLARSSSIVLSWAQQAPVVFLSLPLLGALVIILVAIGASNVNFQLARAKRKGQRFLVESTAWGDSVTVFRA
jgi:hypothetical protein